MEIGFAKCEQVLNTLPIGYYTGRRINVTLDEKEPTSFYSLTEDSIVVSYPMIANRMKELPDTADVEGAVRAMLYHEVSHAILTPKTICTDVPVNIFEDERIESILQNYYHNVDFRQQLYDTHGGHPPKAVNADTAFFNAVRFGLGGAKVQKSITSLIKKYAKINRATPEYNFSGALNHSDYTYEIHQLYREIANEFHNNKEAFQPPEGQEGQKGQGNPLDKLVNQQGQEQAPSSPDNDEGDGEGEGEESIEMAETVGDPLRDIEATGEEVKRMVGASLGKNATLNPTDQKKLVDFQKTVEMIIGNFNKKNSGGSGVNAYSGVFNPRAVTRPDYRYFDRAMTTQGNNRFGTCHLNLIIDCSGSFYENVNLTNCILASLTEVERKNRNFSMDVAFINHEYHPCESIRDRQMTADGGNAVPPNMKQILIAMQKPQTCNYNIILFDGDAMCNNRDCHSNEDYQRRFGAFDMKQTTMITDPDNKKYLTHFTSTKVVITHDYTNELIDHIVRALTVAFG